MERSWILLGMMGSGKSALGREIARLADREFIDTDLMVQTSLCRPISQIFKLYGEEAFREHETAALRKLAPARTVVSTGGGIVLRAENWVELRRLGLTVFLDAPIGELVERLERSRKRRPLLQGDDWQGNLEARLEERRPLYSMADVRVEVGGGGIEETARLVIGTIEAAT